MTVKRKGGVRADLPVEWTCPQFSGQDGLWWPTCTAKLNCLQTFHHWVVLLFKHSLNNNTASKSLEGKLGWKVWQCLWYEQIPVLIGGGDARHFYPVAMLRRSRRSIYYQIACWWWRCLHTTHHQYTNITTTAHYMGWHDCFFTVFCTLVLAVRSALILVF